MPHAIRLRLLKDDMQDYLLLHAWCSQEDIYRYFEQRILSVEEICKKYAPRTRKDALRPVYMILYDDTPIGIIQYHLLTEEEQRDYQLCQSRAMEIDVFIGDAACRGKGFGTQAVRLLMDMLTPQYAPCLYVMCPLTENEPAIKSYEKCGFEKQRTLQLPDTIGQKQTYLLMTKPG